MFDKPITVVSSSKDSDSSILNQSLEYYNDVVCLKQFNYNNGNKSLASIYNKYITEKYAEKSDIVIFCHDDIEVNDIAIRKKLYDAIGDDSEYAICGVAGTDNCVIKEQNLWHVMNNDKPFSGASGAVAHYTGKDDTECFMSNFGVTPKRVVLLDGVFIAVNLKKIIKAGLKFDEKNPAKFHFYDLDFCLQANKLGLKMTTWPIWITHRSHGLSDINDVNWNKGNKYFIKKWS